jgi:hypothetical protein
MKLDLTDDEEAALTRLLKDTIDADRFPLSPRIPDVEGDARQDPTGAGARAFAATAEALRSAASRGGQETARLEPSSDRPPSAHCPRLAQAQLIGSSCHIGGRGQRLKERRNQVSPRQRHAT